MDNFTFISELVKSLAWPLSIFAIVYLLKNEIAKLLEKLTSIKHGDTEFSFIDKLTNDFNEDVELKDGSEKGDGLEKKPNINKPNTDDEEYVDQLKPLVKIAKDSSNIAISQAYSELEQATLRRYGIPRDKPQSLSFFEDLEKRFPKNSQAYFNMRKIRDVRNRVVHLSENISEGETLSYLKLCNNILKHMKSVDEN